MIFDNNIKPSQLLVPILFGLLSFVITTIALNASLDWPEKPIKSEFGSIIEYKPSINIFSSTPDILLTPLKDSLDTRVPILSTKRFIYNRFPLLLIWIMTVGVLIGFGFSFIPIFINKIREYGFKWYYFIFAILFILLLFFPQYIGTEVKVSNLIMPREIHSIFGIGFTKFALNINSIVPFVPIIFWIVLIMSILMSAYNKRYDVHQIKISKSDFEGFYIVVAICLGLSIFSNNIFNTATNQILQATGSFKILPNEFAFINAITYSFVLILSYIFISGYLNSLLMNNASDQTNNNLNIKSFAENLTVILSMLAPMLGGWAADLVKLVNI